MGGRGVEAYRLPHLSHTPDLQVSLQGYFLIIKKKKQTKQVTTDKETNGEMRSISFFPFYDLLVHVRNEYTPFLFGSSSYFKHLYFYI